MFKRLFSRKTKTQVLQEEYRKLLELSYKLAKTNRTKSDEKMVEAQAKLDELEKLEKLN